jgi:hypothetical protein
MKTKYFLFFIPICFIWGCSHKETTTCIPLDQPLSITFEIIKSGKPLPDDSLRFVKMSYTDSGTKIYVNDLLLATNAYANKGLLSTSSVVSLSENQNFKTFYLEYPSNLSTDTLYIDYGAPSPLNDCELQLQPVKINNQIAPIDTSIMYTRVYVINKP